MTTDDKTDGIRAYGPGKFATILDSYVYGCSLDGCDDEIGSVTENGHWYGIIRGLSTDYPDFKLLNPVEQLELQCAGVILTEDDQGFVSVDYYTTDTELNDAWDAICSDFEDETTTDE